VVTRDALAKRMALMWFSHRSMGSVTPNWRRSPAAQAKRCLTGPHHRAQAGRGSGDTGPHDPTSTHIGGGTPQCGA
jgi:hypothetical protein